jgi:hypothetical protein
MAAQRREAERDAREQARLAKEQEKVLRELHLQEQQRRTVRKTAKVEGRIKILDEVLNLFILVERCVWIRAGHGRRGGWRHSEAPGS